MGSHSTNSEIPWILSHTTCTYWKSIMTHLKSFIYGFYRLCKEILVDGEARKNSNFGTETQYEIEYGLFEMYKIFKVQRKIQFQKIVSWKIAIEL